MEKGTYFYLRVRKEENEVEIKIPLTPRTVLTDKEDRTAGKTTLTMVKEVIQEIKKLE